MTKAAGVLFLTPAGTTLFLKRGPGGDMPGTWGFPGGRLEGDETAAEGAIRETLEECGREVAEKDLQLLARNVSPDPTSGDEVDFTTFLVRVGEEFPAVLCDEHTGWCWAAVTTPPEPIHPGAAISLARLSMNELDIARAMAAGQLTSPQKYENVWLFAIRITGTGLSYRQALDEHVWRDGSIYLNDEFLARCNGLTVVMEHPDKATLDSGEFAERVIGSVMLPYISDANGTATSLGDEVWGIAKVYDAAAAEMMSARNRNGYTLSTSPAVVFRDPTVNSKYRQEDGSVLLIEGTPSLLDHIAICAQGVWDKGGPPAGISVHDDIGARKVMSEESEREDAARRDAEAKWDAKLDAVMSACDALAKRFDAFDKERADAAAADAARRDAEEKEREDAARRDEEAKAAADAEEKEREDKARRDEEEEKERKEREDAAAADAARRDSLDTRLVQIERVVASRPADERRALSEAQAIAERAFSAFNDAAPAPMAGETLGDYRRRLARPMQKHSKRWEKIELDSLTEDALAIAESDIYADAISASTDPTVIGAGRLMPITVRQGGHEITRYHGSAGAWMAPLKGAASRAVTEFVTHKGT